MPNFAERLLVALAEANVEFVVLIRTKRAAGRPKDLAVLPTLEATLQMQRELDQG